MARLYDLLRLNFAIYPGVIDYRAADFLHPLYEARKRRQGPIRLAVNVLVAGFWWFWVPVRAPNIARRWNKDRRWVAEATRLAREWFYDPNDLAMWSIVENGGLRTHQRRFEQSAVIRAMESAETDHSAEMIDKIRFQQRCEALELPIPRHAATLRDGAVEWHDRSIRHCLGKPVRGSGGYGIEVFEASRLRDGDVPESLRQGEILVQERLRPHAELRPITFGVLATARIVTLLDEALSPEIVWAGLRFAGRPEAIVDNGHQGGFGALIDISSGEMGMGMVIHDPPEFARHPVSGAPILGRIPPDWPETRELVLKAHRQLAPRQVIVGWDIGLSDHGPVLIEANQRPAVRMTQRLSGKGIGATRYGELVEFHLRRTADRMENRRLLTAG
ncbi:sugar-transfer associated ATP-grasp domain-containing protein [Qipengyuania sp. MTN3-11]|uniref:sugar-transfer associated ATP-grasp domain-containing protein n=1 Tax=Qipengyuania sp. MTN3-11 TaxID=3056557 RepID=UPI0036F25514